MAAWIAGGRQGRRSLCAGPHPVRGWRVCERSAMPARPPSMKRCTELPLVSWLIAVGLEPAKSRRSPPVLNGILALFHRSGVPARHLGGVNNQLGSHSSHTGGHVCGVGHRVRHSSQSRRCMQTLWRSIIETSLTPPDLTICDPADSLVISTTSLARTSNRTLWALDCVPWTIRSNPTHLLRCTQMVSHHTKSLMLYARQAASSALLPWPL